MHRDEAIYARADARGVTLTAEEISAARAALAVSLETEPWNEPIASTLRALAARLEAAS